MRRTPPRPPVATASKRTCGNILRVRGSARAEALHVDGSDFYQEDTDQYSRSSLGSKGRPLTVRISRNGRPSVLKVAASPLHAIAWNTDRDMSLVPAPAIFAHKRNRRVFLSDFRRYWPNILQCGYGQCILHMHVPGTVSHRAYSSARRLKRSVVRMSCIGT